MRTGWTVDDLLHAFVDRATCSCSQCKGGDAEAILRAVHVAGLALVCAYIYIYICVMLLCPMSIGHRQVGRHSRTLLNQARPSRSVAPDSRVDSGVVLGNEDVKCEKSLWQRGCGWEI